MGRQDKDKAETSPCSLGSLPEGIKPLTKDDLKIGSREKRLLKELFDWGEQSRNTHWILGEPYGG